MQTRRDKTDSGQALVESALTLPLVLFCVLGGLQLFLLLHARLAAEYGVYRAVRAGSLNHGDCRAMTHAALLAVLPAVTRTDSAGHLRDAFAARSGNRYQQGRDGHDGPIVELWREEPKAWNVPEPEDLQFDQPGRLMRLEARMVFWVRLQIPFADWVFSRMFLAFWGVKNYQAANPLSPTQTANWSQQSQRPRWPGGDLGEQMRAWSDQGRYLFPIQTNFSMRMMTPAKKRFWSAQGCAL